MKPKEESKQLFIYEVLKMISDDVFNYMIKRNHDPKKNYDTTLSPERRLVQWQKVEHRSVWLSWKYLTYYVHLFSLILQYVMRNCQKHSLIVDHSWKPRSYLKTHFYQNCISYSWKCVVKLCKSLRPLEKWPKRSRILHGGI